MWSLTLSDAPLIAWYIGVLAFLEGLLSADNALVLALMVRHLPRRDQRRVLIYGIWGAIGFRVVAVLLSAILLKFWFFKVAGGLYLLYLAIAHFVTPPDDEALPAASAGTQPAYTPEIPPTEKVDGSVSTPCGAAKPRARRRRWLRGFWGTVTSVTMADIAFSIDSILAAVAMADSFPPRFGPNGKVFIVITGGVLGIITMRFVVRYFLILLDRFPGLAEGAYALVAWIGLKLTVSGLYDAGYIGVHVPEALFWIGMVVIAAVSFVIKPRAQPPGGADASKSLDLLESEEEPPNGGQDAEAHHPVRTEPHTSNQLSS
jgi:YkoY family integral membrane protein